VGRNGRERLRLSVENQPYNYRILRINKVIKWPNIINLDGWKAKRRQRSEIYRPLFYQASQEKIQPKREKHKNEQSGCTKKATAGATYPQC
jgi:dTDP-4-amino-4,6-dideoxygalactose transaminase